MDGKDWMRRLTCVFTESILLYGVCCALAKTKYSTLKAWRLINIDFQTSKEKHKTLIILIFKVFSDHHTQVHTRTRWHHSVNRWPGYRKYPNIDFPKITALIGFDLVIVINVWFCFVDILKYQSKGRGKKSKFWHCRLELRNQKQIIW